MSNINKSKIEMKGELSEKGADYYAKKRADALYVAAVLGGIASLIFSIGFFIDVFY